MTFSPLRLIRRAMHRYAPIARTRVAELTTDLRQRPLSTTSSSSTRLRELTNRAVALCERVKNDEVLGPYFTRGNPWDDRPWKDFDYWNGWYALAQLTLPSKILEVGTAFGFSTVSLARGAGEELELLVSLDLGNFGVVLTGNCKMDNLRYVREGIDRLSAENAVQFQYLQFEVNTQPPPYTDNEGHTVACPYWRDRVDLVSLLRENRFELVLIDGKHTDDALLHDMRSFYGCLASGGLMICDDLQHPDAIKSFTRFVTENSSEIEEQLVWKFLRADTQYGGTTRRDQGLLLKK